MADDKEWEERMEKAKEVSLTDLSRTLGFTPIRIGRYYTLKEYDSVRIYNDKTWYRWSDKTGGTQIDFLMVFGGCGTVREAVEHLLVLQGIHPDFIVHKEIEKQPQFEFELPPKAENYKRLFAYLTQVRKLSCEVISYFIDQGLLYEDALHHNCVFVGRDKDGIPRHAACRGTNTFKKFVGDVPGNDKSYGVNIINPALDEVKVFEAAIDLMSYMDLTGDYTSNKQVLGMTADNPLERLLKDNSHIKKISFCLDWDKAGQEAVYGKKNPDGTWRQGLLEKYRKKGYLARDISGGYVDRHLDQELRQEFTGKDYNEMLVYKRNQELVQCRENKRKHQR